MERGNWIESASCPSPKLIISLNVRLGGRARFEEMAVPLTPRYQRQRARRSKIYKDGFCGSFVVVVVVVVVKIDGGASTPPPFFEAKSGTTRE